MARIVTHFYRCRRILSGALVLVVLCGSRWNNEENWLFYYVPTHGIAEYVLIMLHYCKQGHHWHDYDNKTGYCVPVCRTVYGKKRFGGRSARFCPRWKLELATREKHSNVLTSEQQQKTQLIRTNKILMLMRLIKSER